MDRNVGGFSKLGSVVRRNAKEPSGLLAATFNQSLKDMQVPFNLIRGGDIFSRGSAACRE